VNAFALDPADSHVRLAAGVGRRLVRSIDAGLELESVERVEKLDRMFAAVAREVALAVAMVRLAPM
jgi:hypothetical protein